MWKRHGRNSPRFKLNQRVPSNTRRPLSLCCLTARSREPPKARGRLSELLTPPHTHTHALKFPSLHLTIAMEGLTCFPFHRVGGRCSPAILASPRSSRLNKRRCHWSLTRPSKPRPTMTAELENGQVACLGFKKVQGNEGSRGFYCHMTQTEEE